MKPETVALLSTHYYDRNAGAVSPPIYLSTTYERDADGSFKHGYLYTRNANPNRDALERSLSALEGGVATVCFASGQAATLNLLLALSPGDHVVIPADAYYGTPALLEELMHPWGLTYTRADMTDPAQVRAAMHENTRVVWVETPSNPLLRIVDIQAIAEAAHAGGAICVCDNTWASPVLQHPLALGCDVVMHSTTKYLSGHADVLGGALIFKEDSSFYQRVRRLQSVGGAVPSPFECWLVLRGIKTLVNRVRTQTETAGLVAAFLAEHPNVEAVHYPGLPSHPGHAIAKKQMSAFGAMLSIQVRGGAEEAMRVAAKVQVFTRATSMGGVESLIEHRASVEGPNSKTPPNLLRLSIGLEHADDLIFDLKRALE
jgi:cystathionine gamma-synthase